MRHARAEPWRHRRRRRAAPRRSAASAVTLAGLGQAVGVGQRPQLRPEAVGPRGEPCIGRNVRGARRRVERHAPRHRTRAAPRSRSAAARRGRRRRRASSSSQRPDRGAAGRREVLATEGLLGRRSKAGGGLDGEAAGLIVDRAELGSVLVHLLEVVGDDDVALVVGDAASPRRGDRHARGARRDGPSTGAGRRRRG